MGVARGMDDLRWLFAVTSVASLFAVLVFGGVVARTNRRRFIPIAYLFVIACLIGYATLLIQDVRAGGGLIGTDAETGLARGVGYTFYVWLSVINLFSTSVFWAFMVDVFDVDQGKRMFPFIGIGGTLGALAGGRGASLVSGLTESPYLPAGFMLIGAGCFALAIAVMLILDRRAGASDLSRLGAGSPADRRRTAERRTAGRPKPDSGGEAMGARASEAGRWRGCAPCSPRPTCSASASGSCSWRSRTP